MVQVQTGQAGFAAPGVGGLAHNTRIFLPRPAPAGHRGAGFAGCVIFQKQLKMVG